jgi:hypothetical protein
MRESIYLLTNLSRGVCYPWGNIKEFLNRTRRSSYIIVAFFNIFRSNRAIKIKVVQISLLAKSEPFGDVVDTGERTRRIMQRTHF